MSKILIIPAAGLASRLRPLTSASSKAMLPVNGKPVIAYIIDQALSVYDKIVVVYGQSNDLPNFINSRYKDNGILLAQQTVQNGVLSAVLAGMQLLRLTDRLHCTDQLTVWLGDTIVTDYNSKFDKDEVVVSAVPDWSRWCLVDADITYYDKPVERPPTNKALVGIYTFNDALNAYINTCTIINGGYKVKNEFQMSQLLEYYRKTTQLVVTREWYDCGDFQSLYESKARLITKLSRPDNTISVDVNRSSVTKSGERCKNEIAWYSEISEVRSAKPYVPQLYDSQAQINSYTIAYCPGSTLQETFAFEDLKPETINYTLQRTLDAYFDCFGSATMELKLNRDIVLRELIESKLDRVLKYTSKYNFVTDDDVAKYINQSNYCYNKILEMFKHNEIKIKKYGHGDFHFANILFDYNTGSVKFIDPKGPSTETIELYDLIKFYQSFYGDYLWIKTDTVVNPTVKKQILEFCDKYFTNLGYDVTIIKQMVPILMGSVLQFHHDRPDHQRLIWNKTLELLTT